MPSASSIAGGEHGGARDHPGLAGALDPQRVQRGRRLQVADLDPAGHLADVGHQEVHERRVDQLPGVVVGHPLVQRAADALGDAAVDLALDDPRVDQRAAVVHHAVAQDRDLGRVRVGLHDRGVHPGGERRTQRRVVAAPLDPRLVVLGDRRPVELAAARELGRRPAPRRRRRNAAGWTAPPPCRSAIPVPRIALDPDHPVDDLQVVRGGLQRLRRHPQRLRPGLAGGQRRPRSRSSPRRGRRTCRPRSRTGGCRRSPPRPRSTGTPSSSATIWANTVWWPWPWVVSPVATLTLPEVSTRTWPPSYGPTPVPST